MATATSPTIASPPPTEEYTLNTTSDDAASSSSSEASPIVAVEVTAHGDVQCLSAEDSTILPESNLRNLTNFWIVTTAALPWRTGTAVNPLLRALALCSDEHKKNVTLHIPWVENADARRKLYGDKIVLNNCDEQEAWIREYCVERCGASQSALALLKIRFWKGLYQESFGSIFPLEDICSTIPVEDAQVVILEEPEHLNWFRVPVEMETSASPSPASMDTSGRSTSSSSKKNYDNETLGWAHKFPHVVGILHTNYGDYIRSGYFPTTTGASAMLLNSLCSLTVRAYCHRVIALSATLPVYHEQQQVTCNVHGVRQEFLEVGNDETQGESDDEEAPVYFIGKLVWAKGFENVLELQEKYKESSGKYFPMDVYGNGKDRTAIQKAFFGRHSTDDGSMSSNTSDNKAAADVFGSSASLRDQICGTSDDALVDNACSLRPNASTTATAQADSSDDDVEMQQVLQRQQSQAEEKKTEEDVLGDVTGKTLSASVETAETALRLFESVVAGFGATLGGGGDEKSAGKKKKRSVFHLAPAKTRFKWRRHPIPARFLGVKDHIMVRAPKIFLNMSTSEVLCTTSAEALAMGKFVILPVHPSNTFFLQFPNCLAYESVDECVEKIQYAMKNDPAPLAAEHKHILSWEGATERLFQASTITSERQIINTKAAEFHVDAARKSHFVGTFIRSKIMP